MAAGPGGLPDDFRGGTAHRCRRPDHEAKLERSRRARGRAGKRDEYLELAQRTKADFENYRKRAAREDAAARSERGSRKLAQELLPARRRSRPRARRRAGQQGTDGDGTLVSGRQARSRRS